jgi:hypothetical protein
MIATSNRVYPVGYSTLGSQEYIDGLMGNPQMLLIDTRISPKSWNAEWCKDALQAKYGDRYRWAGKFLGNIALGTGRIEIANPAVGIKGLVKYLDEGHDLILLCQCTEFSKCHRSEIVRLLTEQVAVDVTHWQPQPRETALPIVELNSCIEEIKPPDLHARRSTAHCSICLDAGMMVPATLVSPSGREDSVYCEAHGHCKRCGSSVEQFVKYPYGDFYVCSCVAAYAEQTRLIEEMKQAKPVAFSF